MVDVTITLTDEQSAAITEHGIDVQAVAVAALADAVQRAALAAVDEQANVLRAEALATVVEMFPPPETDPAPVLSPPEDGSGDDHPEETEPEG
jgi:hypothetical protein